MAAGRFDRAPTLLVSAVLHVAAGLAIWYFWPKTPPQPFEFGNGVAINVITEASGQSEATPTPAVEQATTPTPAPEEAPPTPAPPTPEPAAPAPPPKSFITPSKPQPAVRNTAAPGCRADDFLCSASAALKPGGKPKAPPGPEKAGGDTHKRVGTYDSLTGGEQADFAGPLGQVWEKNCLVLGGARADVYIEVVIGPNGYFTEQPKARAGTPTDQYTQAAVTRAIAALKKVEPYKVPPRFTEFRTSFHFDPKGC